MLSKNKNVVQIITQYWFVLMTGFNQYRTVQKSFSETVKKIKLNCYYSTSFLTYQIESMFDL